MLAAAAFALTAGLATGECPAPALSAAVAPAPADKQGAILAVTLESSAPLARADVSFGPRTEPMERDAGGRTFRALVGVDFETETGPRELQFSAVDACGARHAVARRVAVVSGRFPSQKLKVPPAYVEPPASELDRIKEDHEKVARVWETGELRRRWSGPFRTPVDAPLRDNFGSRRMFNGKPRSSHEGMDIAAPMGLPVSAPAPARVALADELYFSGGTVILDHGAGLFTLYFHLSRLDVKPGQILEAGHTIGAVGASGRATGPHLHWGARLDHARVNPLGLLDLPDWPLPSSGIGLTSQSK
jgi:murein DD-endopeptidase MepM/ murein hydrolase activator NlpD